MCTCTIFLFNFPLSHIVSHSRHTFISINVHSAMRAISNSLRLLPKVEWGEHAFRFYIHTTDQIRNSNCISDDENVTIQMKYVKETTQKKKQQQHDAIEQKTAIKNSQRVHTVCIITTKRSARAHTQDYVMSSAYFGGVTTYNSNLIIFIPCLYFGLS